MARMLENQASQVLKEASDLGAGTAASSDIRGFSNIAFPIVRRVFGGLIANDLVSIQPMSLPSGLLFYLDYTYGDDVGKSDATTDANRTAPYLSGDSIYSSPTAKGVRSGSLAAGGQYDLAGAGYSRARGSKAVDDVHENKNCFSFQGGALTVNRAACTSSGDDAKLLQFDPQILDMIDTDSQNVGLFVQPISVIEASSGDLDKTMVREIALVEDVADTAPAGLSIIPAKVQAGRCYNVRRLNQIVTVTRDDNGDGTLDTATDRTKGLASVKADPFGDHVLFVVFGLLADDGTDISVEYVKASAVDAETGVGSTITVPGFESDFTAGVNAGDDGEIPEIDIKIESIAVTAITRKLRAKWTPELAQDLNAYHSLDAEVELTQILSEQIALEIDREILGDLLHSANAANLYWSRAPGKFVNKESGAEIARTSSLNPGPAFTGTVREWYETLTETIIDVANQIHRKTLRGSANFIVVGPDVATILESSVMYRPSYSLDGEGQVSQPMSIGADKVGTLSNRFTVYKDPYFPRNKVLVGYKGGSYLESGYVYAPYVPLIVTPTIFAPEDFTPRKGVMTRYGKKMVRSDFFGTVTCMDMNVI